MEEEMKNEIEKAAELLGMTEAEAFVKFEDILTKNEIDVEQEPLLARGLWRQFFSSARNIIQRTETTTTTSKGSFYKSAFGFFVSLDEARDMGEIQRKKVLAEYKRDEDVTYNMGKVALFTEVENEDNNSVYEGRLMFEGEEIVRTLESVPDNNVELDNGQWLVPINTLDAEWNKSNYGKPLPKTDWRRSGIFIGEIDGTMGKYFFSYRGKAGHEKAPVKFSPLTFEYVHFTCTLNQNDERKIHGAVSKTVDSLFVNADLSDDDEMKRNVDSLNMQDALMEYSELNYSPLIDLEKYHNEVEEKTWDDRYVFTDGNVTSINMTQTKNGSRIVTLDDLTTAFDYESEEWSGTTCWIPSHIPIDFGIGSNVIIVGRTSQGIDENNQTQPVSVNVNGILIVKSRGGSPEDITSVEEDDWLFD